MNTFFNAINNLTIKDEVEANEYYKKAYVDSNSYIFVIDTNALIRTFQFDSEALKTFENSLLLKNYYTTKQIEIEFLRNKDYLSNYYWVDLNQKMIQDFEAKVVINLRTFFQQYSHILSTENEIQKKVKRHLTSTVNILKTIRKTALSFSETRAHETIANTLKIIKENVNVHYSLKDKDYERLLEEYKNLVLKYQKLLSEKKNFENEYRAYVFPGMGEKKDINPEGDYFIFHEMIELAKETKKNIIFLTNDITKGDWVEKKSGKNYIHYQTAFYILSKQGIKVRNFEEYILEDLGIKTEKLLETEGIDYDEEFMGNFLVKWSNIEKRFNELLLQRGVTTRPKPIRESFLDIKEMGLLTNIDYSDFASLNIIRNKILHGHFDDYKFISEIEKDELLFKLDKINESF